MRDTDGAPSMRNAFMSDPLKIAATEICNFSPISAPKGFPRFLMPYKALKTHFWFPSQLFWDFLDNSEVDGVCRQTCMASAFFRKPFREDWSRTRGRPILAQCHVELNPRV